MNSDADSYVVRWQKRLNAFRAGKPSYKSEAELIDAARAHYASLTLGRQFGQTIESFEIEHPEIKDLFDWIREQDELTEVIGPYRAKRT